MHRLLLICIGIVILLSAVLVFSHKYSFFRFNRSSPAVPTPVLPAEGSRRAASSPSVISGTVIALEGDAITLRTIPPAQDEKPKTYAIKLRDDTTIFRRPVIIPYLAKEEKRDSLLSAKVDELRKGMFVDVVAKGLNTPDVEAVSVTLPRFAYVIEGIVQTVDGEGMTVDAVPVLETRSEVRSPEHKLYTVTVTGDTEISRQIEPGADGTGGEIKIMSISDIEKDQRVIVYSSVDLTKIYNFEAERIEPISINSAHGP